MSPEINNDQKLTATDEQPAEKPQAVHNSLPSKSLSSFISNNKRFSKTHMIAVALIFAILGSYFISRSFAAVPNYYVDCAAGSDSATGTSETSSWKSLTKASQAPLQPGSSLLLKRGCTWTDVLNAGWNGTATSSIVIGSYGDESLPIPVITSNVNGRSLVSVTGSYLVFENILAKGQAPKLDPACQNNPVGYIVGFNLRTGSSNNKLRNVEATGNYAGVAIKEGSHHNRVLGSKFFNNTMMNPLDTALDNDAGAFGVALFGDDNEIAGNTFQGQYACSYDYNGDGAAIEIYGGQRNNIHHNRAENNEAFTELGNIRSADNVYAYNQVTSSIATSSFLITRGGTDNRYGPINGTKAYNNTVYLTGSASNGIVCHGGCSANILSAKNNILWAGGKSLYADAPFDEGNNIYWRTGGSPVVQASINTTSQKIDPKFLDVTKLNFHLQTGSQAIDRGANHGYITDLDNKTVPIGTAPDIGSYEYGTPSSGGDTTSPTTSITAPISSATVINMINLTATATDNTAATKVDFLVDGAVKGSSTASPYTYSWNTKAVANGTHTLQTKAYDAAGNVGSSAVVSVTVNNTVAPPADTTAPIVTISSPANGAQVSRTVTIATSATDNVEVASIEIYIDGKLYSSSQSNSLTTIWNTKRVTTGAHILLVKAKDTAGNVGETSVAVYK